jgi:CubicO group peptidase (beta-lactamase class C family)
MGANLVAQNHRSYLDDYFSALYRNQQFNGNVLVAENGKIIYENSFGFADFTQKRLNDKQSRFPIASITKTFTATAILQLKEKGKLKIDDPVIRYIKDFP